MKRPRRSYSAEFKAHVALASLHRDAPIRHFAEQFDVHPNLVRAWQSQLLCRAARLFEEPVRSSRYSRVQALAFPESAFFEYTGGGEAPPFQPPAHSAAPALAKSR